MLSGKVVRTMAENYPEKLKIVTRKFLPNAASVVESAAKRNINNATGMLRSSIMSNVSGDEATISANATYAAYVEYGTRPHDINSPVKIKGNWVYIGRHPGTKATPFMRPALDKNRMKLIVLFRKIMGQVYGR